MSDSIIQKVRNYNDTSISVRFLATGIVSAIDRKVFEHALSYCIKDYEWVSGSKEDERWFKDLQNNCGKKFTGSANRAANKYFKSKDLGSFDFNKVPMQDVK